MEPENGRAERTPLFLASAAFLVAGLVAALVVLSTGDLADAGDDVLALLFALAAITGLGGWYRQIRAGDDRVARVEEERLRLEAELAERESSQRALERRLDERETEHSRQKAELEEALQEREEAVRERESELTTERGLRARLQHAHKVEREWTRELRSQVMQMHREQGALGHTGDVREMVLQVTLKLVE
ncbi:MAG: hypothetical protein H0V12_05670, partial [Chloroflexi bacterium]|nr:hypothetical protein [Chloroflexota bacterium]